MIADEENRVLELVGGLRNALERGETLARAKQTFINAGYKKLEVDEAGKIVSQVSSRQGKEQGVDAEEPVEKKKKERAEKKRKKAEKKKKVNEKALSKKVWKKLKMPRKKMSSRVLWVVTIIISVLILVGAAILGLNWDKWFG